MPKRDIHADMLAALGAEVVALRWLGEFDWPTGIVRVWTGYGPLQWDSHTWDGVGTFGGIGDITETEEIRANGVSVVLNGIPFEILQPVIGQRIWGRPAKLYLMALGATGVIANPIRMFSGRMDTAEISEASESCSIVLQMESRLADLQRHRGRRRNDQDQRLIHPDDTGMRYTAGLQGKELFWGRPGPTPVSMQGGGVPSEFYDPTIGWIEDRGAFMP